MPEERELAGRIQPMHLEQEMKTSFISYAMSVIIDRALPDVRDGLKPVHRRILFDMDELGLDPDKPHRKSALTVGDVLGKYHPHGDSSVYDAMVRLAQPFNMRYPLVDPHGNFGSVDGDGAAAMRYTEARLSKLATEMLVDIEKDTVNFVPNFDETRTQPTVLPAHFPNLLVNGSGGIAVGMATNIPPHNLGETIDGLIALIDNPDITSDELMQYIPGPDFPTGGIIMGKMGIASAYRTGRGKIVVRARAEIEQYAKDRSRIVVTEIPYQVNKARLVENIAQLHRDKKIEGISDLRDESGRNGMRIVIELKKDVNANVVLNLLYKHTQLQDTFGAIMLALVDGEPRVLSLRDMLFYYLEHRKDVVTRRTRYDLEKAKERLHILEGLLIALDNIDEVVELIKKSPNAKEAKDRLMERFGLSERQSQAILDMRLQRLTGLERDKIVEEDRQLKERVAYLESILADEHKLLGIIRDEALDIKARYADPRRTEITQMIDDIDLDDIIQVEDMAVTMTHFGYIKRISPDTYRAQHRGGRGVKGQATREEDFVESLFVTCTHAPILFFTNMGRVYKIKCYAIPEAGRAAKGIPIVNLLQLQGGEKVTATIPLPWHLEEECYLVMATRDGVIKKTPMSEFDNIRKGGLIALNLREGDELMSVELSNGDDEFIIATKKGKAVRFDERDVRAMGRTATGVRAITLEGGDTAVDMVKVVPDATVLTVTEKGMGKRTEAEQYPMHRRGGKGVLAMMLTDKTGDLTCLKMVKGDEDLMLIRDDGTIMRMPVSQVNVIGRNTQGVRLMRVDEGTKVVSIAVAPHSEEEDEAEGEAITPVTEE
ncbi:MAG: DNA gyrase subunit A [Clostridium sp.]|nr:DNA gyrase subunit A [Clostridium sp.]MDY6081402.1 DNA gyrase subunit A [Eubacteriales bacterium]